MALTTLLYLAILLFCIIVSVMYHPFVGLIGYLSSYLIFPAGHWWGYSGGELIIRSSYWLAVATALGILLHRSKLKFERLLDSHEILLLIFLACVWISTPLGLGMNPEETYALKMTKIVIALMMATHLVTDLKRYETILWVLIVAALYIGIEAYRAGPWYFMGGRIDRGIGGSDFSEGNFLAAHLSMSLPFILIMFLKGGWKSKAICFFAAAFSVNSIILCRSRGVFLALTAGAISGVVLAQAEVRKKMIPWVLVGLLGAFYLTDPGFWMRIKEITFSTEQTDRSILVRIEAWKGAFEMVKDHPLGVGEGNFKRIIGEYNPAIAGKDTHNTLLRCLAELGIQGLFVLLLLIGNAFRLLSSVSKLAEQSDKRKCFLWHIYATRVALIIFLSSGLFITHTYIEEFYWLLMFPLFLKRSVQNDLAERPIV
ncbi:MAG: O-antigen ligase family protein [Candidatus Hodarchaeota archaeon]